MREAPTTAGKHLGGGGGEWGTIATCGSADADDWTSCTRVRRRRGGAQQRRGTTTKEGEPLTTRGATDSEDESPMMMGSNQQRGRAPTGDTEEGSIQRWRGATTGKGGPIPARTSHHRQGGSTISEGGLMATKPCGRCARGGSKVNGRDSDCPRGIIS